MEDNLSSEVVVVRSAPSYESRSVLAALGELFNVLGLNSDNPFSDYVKPGATVLIKPNWVRDRNPLGYNLDSLVSHSALIERLIDFLMAAMVGEGIVVIGDAPLQDCDFKNLMRRIRMAEIIQAARQRYPNAIFLIEDWRLTRMEGGAQFSAAGFGGQPAEGHRIVDLGRDSFLEEVSDRSDRFRVTCYQPSLMREHHAPGKHEYLITSRIFEADFIINLAKMKTHIKAGLTGAMKNLVGANVHKEFLPHHTKGTDSDGGDNYPTANVFKKRYEDVYDNFWEGYQNLSVWRRWLGKAGLKVLWGLSRLSGADGVSAGSWPGNDTIWRTILDLNHIVYFKAKKHSCGILNIVDGIVAGEGEGPLSPVPRPLGILIGGKNPACVDAVMGKLMGYDIGRVPSVHYSLRDGRSKFSGDPADWKIVWSEDRQRTERRFSDLPSFQFKKPSYWR